MCSNIPSRGSVAEFVLCPQTPPPALSPPVSRLPGPSQPEKAPAQRASEAPLTPTIHCLYAWRLHFGSPGPAAGPAPPPGLTWRPLPLAEASGQPPSPPRGGSTASPEPRLPRPPAAERQPGGTESNRRRGRETGRDRKRPARALLEGGLPSNALPRPRWLLRGSPLSCSAVAPVPGAHGSEARKKRPLNKALLDLALAPLPGFLMLFACFAVAL